jgi:lipoprotein-releasing system permease protein
LIHLPTDMFMVSYLPMELNPRNFVLNAAATIVLCLLAGVYPAVQAARFSPVEVIRYE